MIHIDIKVILNVYVLILFSNIEYLYLCCWILNFFFNLGLEKIKNHHNFCSTAFQDVIFPFFVSPNKHRRAPPRRFQHCSMLCSVVAHVRVCVSIVSSVISSVGVWVSIVCSVIFSVSVHVSIVCSVISSVCVSKSVRISVRRSVRIRIRRPLRIWAYSDYWYLICTLSCIFLPINVNSCYVHTM